MVDTANELQPCIDQCQQCHAICVQTMQYCLRQGGQHADADHIRLLADCAQICATSAEFMLRDSPLHNHTCGACAAVCEQCAQSCGGISDGETMQQCAEACRRCAESCREMAGTAR